MFIRTMPTPNAPDQNYPAFIHAHAYGIVLERRVHQADTVSIRRDVATDVKLTHLPM
ncbi:hypothetical protein D3C74_484850 [compost metagenome]